MFKIEDDGIGLNADNIAAFDELFSDRKKPVGGKGRGRFTYLKVFAKNHFESVFVNDGKRLKRSFAFGFNYKGCPSAGTPTTEAIGTKVVLSAMLPEYAKNVPKDAAILARDFLVHFMPVLLSNNKVAIILNDGKDEDLAKVVQTDLLVDSEPDDFEIGDRKFQLSHVRLRPRRGLRHRLILAAAAREVDGVDLEKHIPTLSPRPLGETEESEGHVIFGIVQGDYLDEIADPLRLSFRDDSEDVEAVEPEKARHDLLGDPVSISQVRRISVERVRKRLEPELVQAVQERATAIGDYIRRDGMGYHFLRGKVPEIAERLRTTDDRTIENALHTAAYEERKDRSEQVHALLKATPKEKAEKTYFQRWHETVSKLSEVSDISTCETDLAS